MKTSPTRTESALSPLTDQLRHAIRARSGSAYELAQVAGVDSGILSRFLRGERDVTLATADRLAVALGLKLVKGGRSK